MTKSCKIFYDRVGRVVDGAEDEEPYVVLTRRGASEGWVYIFYSWNVEDARTLAGGSDLYVPEDSVEMYVCGEGGVVVEWMDEYVAHGDGCE